MVNILSLKRMHGNFNGNDLGVFWSLLERALFEVSFQCTVVALKQFRFWDSSIIIVEYRQEPSFYCSWFKNGRSCSYVLCVLNSCWDVWVFFLCSNLIRFFFRFTFGVWSWDNNFFMIRLLRVSPKCLSRGKMCKINPWLGRLTINS